MRFSSEAGTTQLLYFSEELFTLEPPPAFFVRVCHPNFLTWVPHPILAINFLRQREILFYLVHVHSDTTLPPIKFHNCTKSLLCRGNVTHRCLHIYPMQWHLHSKCICDTNFGRTTAQSILYVHPKTVYLFILF